MSGQELALPRQRGVVAHHSNSADARFLRWYAEYPRKVAIQAARVAYAKALKVADHQDPDNAEALLLAGLRRFKFSPDPTYRPHPATWLNQRRWQDEAPEAEFDSTLAAAGLKPEDFR